MVWLSYDELAAHAREWAPCFGVGAALGSGRRARQWAPCSVYWLHIFTGLAVRLPSCDIIATYMGLWVVRWTDVTFERINRTLALRIVTSCYRSLNYFMYRVCCNVS